MSLVPTASQTVGPFFNFGLTANPCLGVLARPAAEGERVRLRIRVLDGNGGPTPGDAMIELWQADARGHYGADDPNFCGFGRLETDRDGACVFETIKPGRVDGQAPHISVIVFARGLLRHLHTRIYFADDPANADDPALALVPEDRRATILAHPAAHDPGAWEFEIRLQGEGETVFFDV